MYYDNTLKRVRNFGLILSLIIGFTVISGTSAQAQWRDNRDVNSGRYDRDSRYSSLDRAREIGYRDGFKDGAQAGHERDRYHPQNSGDWQKGTNGYEDRYGSKSAYKSAYRESYLRGYREGYDRNDNRGNRRNY
jgi:hypothetical protein